jgi:hypothetical protein
MKPCQAKEACEKNYTPEDGIQASKDYVERNKGMTFVTTLKKRQYFYASEVHCYLAILPNRPKEIIRPTLEQIQEICAPV